LWRGIEHSTGWLLWHGGYIWPRGG
ncbi:4Fe-4S dicluster domain protein, partial [Vibrio parahaemolyticus V-223/04]